MNFKAKQNLNRSPKLGNNVIRTERIKPCLHKEENYSTPGIAIAFQEHSLLFLWLMQPVWAGILFPYLKKGV